MVVMAPADEDECRRMLSTGFHHAGPAAVRYPRGSGIGAPVSKDLGTLPIGKAELRRDGHGIALLAFGAMVAPCTKVADALDATLVNMRFVKPLDESLVLALAKSHAALVTIEDNAIAGGAGSAVAELLNAHGLSVPLLQLGLADTFLEHASREELLAADGLDATGIENAIRRRYPTLVATPPLRNAV
jgi:1-deoxy-D-xylulose-5-phosphate synthase